MIEYINYQETSKGEDIPMCNKCGKPLDIYDFKNDCCIHKKIGYGSKYDGSTLWLRLCSKCMDELIDSCELSPITEVL